MMEEGWISIFLDEEIVSAMEVLRMRLGSYCMFLYGSLGLVWLRSVDRPYGARGLVTPICCCLMVGPGRGGFGRVATRT